MALVWQSGPVLSLGSGLLMALLGAALIRADPRKDWNRIFALLAVFWGVQIIAQNLVLLVTDRPVAEAAGRVSLAFLIPLYFFVVAFAAVYPRPRPPFGTSVVWLTLAILPGALALLILVLEPAQILRGIARSPEGSTFTMRWGPLFPYVVVAPLYAAFLYALFVMTRRLGEAGSLIERRQIAFVLAAVVLYVAYNVPLQLLYFGGNALTSAATSEAQRQEALVIGLIMLVGLALLAYLTVRLVREAKAPLSQMRVEAHAVLATLAVGFVAGATEGVFILLEGPVVFFVGLVRLLSVALIVYAIARYQLFDIHLRIRMGAAALSTALVVGALAAATWIVVRATEFSLATSGVAVAFVAVLFFVLLLPLAIRFADRIAPGAAGKDDLYLRKLEVYRATVESMQGQGMAPEPQVPALVALRGRLGLADEDHGVVSNLVQEERRGKPVELRPGALAFGRYEIGDLIGEGAVGRVYRARDTLLGRNVVIKELLAKWRGDPALVRTFLREAQIAGQLNHPNLVAVHDVEKRGEDHYLILEHVEGGSLAERLEGGKVASDEASRIARDVLAGLGAAHARGVVHRDVKPANIFLTASGAAKVGDFGVADLAADASETTLVGLPAGAAAPGAGTLAYMSPEQAAGRPADGRSDLYAVGATVYRMLTGRPHIELSQMDELQARRRLAAAPAPGRMDLAAVPAPWRPVLGRALAPDPAGRFPDAASFAAALP